MEDQVKSLIRLKSLILYLGILLLSFSLVGFLTMEIFVYKSLAQCRLSFLQRTNGYRKNSINTCISIRNMHISAAVTDPASVKVVSKARSDLQSLSKSTTSIHTMNYVASPSQALLDYFVENTQLKVIPLPGSGSFKTENISFWDLGNDFVLSSAAASLIPLADLMDPDYSVDSMSVSKRAIVFM
jgi:hypothetical protein